jgi:hypothetical protein
MQYIRTGLFFALLLLFEQLLEAEVYFAVKVLQQ